MAQMVVRNIPQQVMDNLRALAQAERVSVEELARRALAEAGEEGRRWRDFVRWSERRLAKQRGRSGRSAGSANLIRADRER